MKHFSKINLFLLILILSKFPINLIAKERIGVMDFTESEGLPSGTGKTAAIHAIMGLLESRKYTVIEKSTVEFILKEQALQNKGCTDTECAVKTGKLIAANLMLTGNIIRLNEKLIVSLNVRNIELGKVEFSETMSITKLSELEATITDSIERFISKEKKEIQTDPDSNTPNLTRAQEGALALTYVCPGLGHLADGQVTKGIFFTSAFVSGMRNLFTIVPKLNAESRRASIWGYRGAIANLSTMDINSTDQASNAYGIFGTLYLDEVRRERQMQIRTLNGVYLLLAAWSIIHLDLHVTVLDNHAFKYFQYIYLNMSSEKTLSRNFHFENHKVASRYEVAFTWSF